MNITRTFDEKYIKSIVSKMWDNVCEDGHSLDDFDPQTEANCWVRVDDVGLYNLHPHNSTTLELHAFILPEKRKQYSRASCNELFRWILDKAPKQYQKIIAQVPFLYPNVKDFSLRQGFQIEGINRLSHLKHGDIHDQWLLGITIDEMKGVVDELG